MTTRPQTTAHAEPSPNDRDGIAVWRAFLECHTRVVEAVERDVMERHGMPLTWFEVLLFLAQVPDGALRMQDLANRVLLSKSGLTRLADRIEAAGLIARKSCSVDRRGTYASITPKGRRALQAASPLVREGIQRRFLAHLTREEAEVLKRVLDKVMYANGFRHC